MRRWRFDSLFPAGQTPYEHAGLTSPPLKDGDSHPMKQSIGHVTLLIREYDQAIKFYVDTLRFRLIEDTAIEYQQKRWVLVAPPGASEARLLLARAVGTEQLSRVGNQTGGRVFLFLHTDDFWRDFNAFKNKGVVFVREPKEESYGAVAVFSDLYGNLWDLIQVTPNRQH